jgi:hypothetical protein
MGKLQIMLVLIASLTRCSPPEVTYYVDITGNDSSGTGTIKKPWRTLAYAVSKVTGNEGHTIKLSAGTFLESDFIRIPPGVNITGAGSELTVLKPDSSLYSTVPEWVFDKFLISLTGPGETGVKQVLKNFSIDGAAKNLYGAILVKDRDWVTLSDLRVQNIFYTGIWLWGTNDCKLSKIHIRDCAWGSSKGCSATIQFTASERLEITNIQINEGIGYGMKAVGDGKMYALKIHHCNIHVTPDGKWKTPDGQSAPNIACELYNVDLKRCEIYHNYFNANLSVAMDKRQWLVPSSYQTIHIHDNTFDLLTSARGNGHGLELTAHNAEVDHNYFLGGSTSIVNWDASAEAHTMHNWKIHHNVFYKLASFYPSSAINFFRMGITNAEIYNNTIELTDTSTINFIEVNNQGRADSIDIRNNLIINSNTGYSWYPNKLISLVNGAVMTNTYVSNNSLFNIAIDSIPGVRYGTNLMSDPKIRRTGKRPHPYYSLQDKSPLIDGGAKISGDYSGGKPDIGALEIIQ